jgi:dTDP-4-amino-4,6-dideoxygalactose transaminase
MDDIRASIGIVQLCQLKEDLIKRSIVRAWYMDALKNIDSVIIPFSDNKEFVSNYIMPIVLKNSTAEKRDLVRDALYDKGIQTSLHYPAIHKFAFYSSYNTYLPKTEYVTDNEITLPMYSKLSQEEVKFIVESLSDTL